MLLSFFTNRCMDRNYPCKQTLVIVPRSALSMTTSKTHTHAELTEQIQSFEQALMIF